VPVASIWESGVEGNMFKGWVLDAKSSEFGENGKYFKHDLAEAKKLVAAAGFPDGLETTLNYPGPSPQNPAVFQVGLEQLIGYSESSGVFKVKRNQIGNFFGEYFPNYHTQVRSQFDGVAIALSLGVAGIDPAGHLFAYYNQRGSLRQGTDQTLSDLTTKAIREFDDKRRMELVHEAQRYEGGMQFFARIGAAEGVALSWPALRNVNVWRGGTGRAFGTVSSTVFIDPERPPLKKA
jgi:ABC-type transport system substrate-binding protein